MCCRLEDSKERDLNPSQYDHHQLRTMHVCLVECSSSDRGVNLRLLCWWATVKHERNFLARSQKKPLECKSDFHARARSKARLGVKVFCFAVLHTKKKKKAKKKCNHAAVSPESQKFACHTRRQKRTRFDRLLWVN